MPPRPAPLLYARAGTGVNADARSLRAPPEYRPHRSEAFHPDQGDDTGAVYGALQAGFGGRPPHEPRAIHSHAHAVAPEAVRVALSAAAFPEGQALAGPGPARGAMRAI